MHTQAHVRKAEYSKVEDEWFFKTRLTLLTLLAYLLCKMITGWFGKYSATSFLLLYFFYLLLNQFLSKTTIITWVCATMMITYKTGCMQFFFSSNTQTYLRKSNNMSCSFRSSFAKDSFSFFFLSLASFSCGRLPLPIIKEKCIQSGKAFKSIATM